MYGEYQMSLEEVSQRFGIIRQRVKQTENRALEKIRNSPGGSSPKIVHGQQIQ